MSTKEKPFKKQHEIISTVMQNGGRVEQTTKDYSSGIILSYRFRIFKERWKGDDTFYIVINDETSAGLLWPAKYTQSELDEWMANTLDLMCYNNNNKC